MRAACWVRHDRALSTADDQDSLGNLSVWYIIAMSPVEAELEAALWILYGRWKGIKYRANYFRRMLTESDPIYKGPVGTVKHLLGKDLTAQSGFERLRREGRLEWTIEALVTEPKWRNLFEYWEIARAEERLSGRLTIKYQPSGRLES